MLPWKLLFFSLFCWTSGVRPPPRRYTALYPSAVRVKRGMASMVNPVFQTSVRDINLLFEILLAGVRFDSDHALFSVRDEELASLHQTKKLEVICEDVLPWKLTDIRRLTFDLLQHTGALHREDFERTVLTLVYTAHQMALSGSACQRDAWAQSFIQLYNTIKEDLTAK